MTVPLAHGAGGSFDELLLLAAGTFIAFGIARTVDKKATRRRRSFGLAMIVAALGLASVPIVFHARTPTTRTGRIASTARIEIISPKPGELINGSFLDVVVALKGGRLVSTASTRLKPDEGHLHLSVDERLYSMTQGESQRVNLTGMTPGEHLLQVEFVAADHGPFSVPVIAVSTFRLEANSQT